MGIFLMIIAIIFFVSILLIFRVFNNYKIDNYQALIVNYFIAALFAITIYSGDLTLTDIPNQLWFQPSLLLGLLYSVGFLIFALSTQKAGIAITSVFSKMSILIPVLFGAYFYESESITIIKISGLFLAMLSFFLIFKSEKSEIINKKAIFLPLLIFLFTGLNDTILKYIREVYFNIAVSDINSEIFIMGSIFSISFIVSIIIFGIPILIERRKIEIKNFIAGAILGIINFLSAFTMFKAMGHFESSVFFPIFNVGIVGLSAIVGVIFFKEKLSKTNYIGLAIALGAILLLTIN